MRRRISRVPAAMGISGTESMEQSRRLQLRLFQIRLPDSVRIDLYRRMGRRNDFC